jgi:Mrp family chromosome partitioning ATPase
VAAKLVDGIVLVVRQNYCTSPSLSHAVKQFGFVEARLLGVVINCSNDRNTSYYKRRYRGYQNRYYGSYAKTGKQDKA